MKLGFVGLGKMGANMVRRLTQGGHEVVAYDRSVEVAKELAKECGESVKAATTTAEVVESLKSPKVVWLMIPSGDPVDAAINELKPMLSKGDIIIDGGNSNFKDSIRRSEELKELGIGFMDAGTSGGVWGLEVGYCLMVGAETETFSVLEPALKTLAPPEGYLHVGPCGSGHYVKMIHNGVEYGIMQAYAEGFDILENSRFDIDLHAVSRLWNQGSVIRSWLLELCERMFEEDPKLKNLEAYVPDSGEGRWTVNESIELSVPAPVITLALQARFRSRQENSFSNRVLAALRNQFGGHAIKRRNRRIEIRETSI